MRFVKMGYKVAGVGTLGISFLDVRPAAPILRRETNNAFTIGASEQQYPVFHDQTRDVQRVRKAERNG